MLRIGGPSLLHTFAKLNKLPSSSYIYKTLKSSIHFEYSFHMDFKDIIKLNIKQFFNCESGFFVIKMDELAINPRARWSPNNNEIP